MNAARFTRCLLLAALAVAAWPPAGATQDFRDPTRPAGARPAAAAAVAERPRLELSGVIVADGRRVAIVNGRPVRAGAEVGGARVLEVLPDGVRLSRAGRIEELRVPRAALRVRPVPKETEQ